MLVKFNVKCSYKNLVFAFIIGSVIWLVILTPTSCEKYANRTLLELATALRIAGSLKTA